MPALVLAAIALIGGAGRSPASPMEDFVRRFTTDRNDIRRYYNTPLSELGATRQKAFDDEELRRLKTIKFATLDRDGQVDWILMRNYLETDLRNLATRKKKEAETLKLLPFAPTIVAWEEDRWKLKPLDPESTARQLEQLSASIDKAQGAAKADLDGGKANEVLAFRAARAAGALRDTFAHWFKHYDGYKPLFSWWCKAPYEEATKKLEDYERFLREDVAKQRGKDDDPLIGDPIGKDALASDLRAEMLGYTPEELIAIAQKEYDWCLKQMIAASERMGYGKEWQKAIEATKQDHVPPGEQDDLVLFQGQEAVQFVEDHKLVTLEPLVKETWRVEMLTAEQQKNWPFAFYGGQHMATSYPLPQMDTDTKLMSMRGNNRHFLRAVTFHELIPGHHLQGYMADRYKPYRQVFTSPFFIEGWALHWEMLFWDMDFAKNDMDRVGMLFWRMHRCARIVVSLKYHLGEMKAQQMIDYLAEKVGHERWTATSEVRRYIGDMYSPLYQCAYLIGGLQLRGLYKELVPAKMTAQQFHDKALRLGSIPMEMIRASLTGEELSPEFSGGKNIRASFE
ncbi:MAG: DUF885 family protein [Armatimonadetes bacterium]|nr:DUF885 family protein [Armatimonadota bacterium]